MTYEKLGPREEKRRRGDKVQIFQDFVISHKRDIFMTNAMSSEMPLESGPGMKKSNGQPGSACRKESFYVENSQPGEF